MHEMVIFVPFRYSISYTDTLCSVPGRYFMVANKLHICHHGPAAQ